MDDNGQTEGDDYNNPEVWRKPAHLGSNFAAENVIDVGFLSYLIIQKLNEIHDFVRDTLNRYYHKLWGIGYHGNEIYFILLALYTVKSKNDSQQDTIKKELSDCIANTLTFFDFDPSDPFGHGIHPSHYFDEVCKDLRSINYDDFLSVYTSIVDEFVDQLMIVYNEYGKINHPRSIISLVDELVRLKNVSSAYQPFANIAMWRVQFE